MWLLKGLAIGILIFFLVAIFYIRAAIPFRPNTAISLDVWKSITYGRPVFWLAFFLVLTAACSASKLLDLVRHR